jgi:diguanylate cyclase (GGDEF)-like protein
MSSARGAGNPPVENSVLIARPLWPVLRQVASIFSGQGYRVEEAFSWDRVLDARLPVGELTGIFLGDHGDTASELEAVRRFRERRGALGVPVILVGGLNAILRAEQFRASGVDLVLPADTPADLLMEQSRPLLKYGALYRSLNDANRTLREMSLRDELTGLPNRRHFSLDLTRNVEMARRIGRPLSCIMVDIDDFKRVNDRYGHPAGDSVIRQFGSLLSGRKRTYDIVARLGGDEFGWLLADTEPEQALQAAARAQQMVAGGLFEVSRDRLSLTATFGVSALRPGGEISGDLLVGNADRALYWGKESGKNTVRFYPAEKDEPHDSDDPHLS